MIRLFTVLIVLCVASANARSITPADPLRIPHQAGESTVYVSKTDKHYHREGCEHVRSDRHAITLSEARTAGYMRCVMCKPVK